MARRTNLKIAPSLVTETPDETISVTISPINFQTIALKLKGISPYVQHKFSEKVRREMEAKQREGDQPSRKKAHSKKDFEADYKAAMHLAVEGWHGVPASAFRSAAISACRVANFVMARAKLSIFVEEDGFDAEGTPLIRISGKPMMFIAPVRYSATVVDLTARPIWKAWSIDNLRVQFDGDQFKPVDIVNLFNRAGQQVGIGEGRPDSPRSDGMGWGRFRVEA